MYDFYFSIFALYGFILGGFILKKIFKEKIDTKSMTLTTIFFFQPILAFWGFTKAPIQLSLIGSGGLYFLTLVLAMMLLFLASKLITSKPKEIALLSFTATSGNTGNLGIPLSGSLFGPIGILAATMFNFMNIIWNVTLGVFFYARGDFSVKDSLLKIFTMPLLWASIAAIIFNILKIQIPERTGEFLELGAHASIVVQLYLLGLFLADIKLKKMSLLYNIWVNTGKFLILPGLGFLILFLVSPYIEIPKIVQSVFLLELMVPLAVNNANLANLYNCKPRQVSETIFTSSLVFLLLVPLLFWLFLK